MQTKSDNQASEVLKLKSPIIMKRWEDRARQEVTSAYRASSLSLRDSLPQHLVQLTTALASCGKKDLHEIADATLKEEDVGKEHGNDRARTADYSIDEVILEYRILRQVLIEVIEEDVKLTLTEREVITDLIEQAVNDAATEFSKTVRDMRIQFTDTLTHDLRGPITAAKVSAQLIQRKLDKPEICNQFAVGIVDSMDRMEAMIQNLLDSSRIRAGEGLSTNFIECDPDTIAKEVAHEMQLIYGDRIKFTAETSHHVWWSYDLIRRAIENLMINAIKYGDLEAPITLNLQEVNREIKITVHNEGNPISESEISNLFQNFRRSKTANEGPSKGWGLGLTLVSGVVNAHKGTINVESSKDHGTSFIMILPKDCRDDS